MPLRAAASFWAVTVMLSTDSCENAGVAASKAAPAVPNNRNERNMMNSEKGTTHAGACWARRQRPHANRIGIQRRGGARLCQVKAVAELPVGEARAAKIAGTRLKLASATEAEGVTKL